MTELTVDYEWKKVLTILNDMDIDEALFKVYGDRRVLLEQMNASHTAMVRAEMLWQEVEEGDKVIAEKDFEGEAESVGVHVPTLLRAMKTYGSRPTLKMEVNGDRLKITPDGSTYNHEITLSVLELQDEEVPNPTIPYDKRIDKANIQTPINRVKKVFKPESLHPKFVNHNGDLYLEYGDGDTIDGFVDRIGELKDADAPEESRKCSWCENYSYEGGCELGREVENPQEETCDEWKTEPFTRAKYSYDLLKALKDNWNLEFAQDSVLHASKTLSPYRNGWKVNVDVLIAPRIAE